MHGVRQGGVLSPILFIVYIDEILTRLESQTVGFYCLHALFCWSSRVCRWHLALSDSALRMMLIYLLSICNTITNFYLIQGKHNLSLPCSSPNPPTSPIFLFAGQSLKLADGACHLDHILHSDLYMILVIFWGFKPICAVELTAFYLLFMPLILLSRLSYFERL